MADALLEYEFLEMERLEEEEGEVLCLEVVRDGEEEELLEYREVFIPDRLEDVTLPELGYWRIEEDREDEVTDLEFIP